LDLAGVVQHGIQDILDVHKVQTEQTLPHAFCRDPGAIDAEEFHFGAGSFGHDFEDFGNLSLIALHETLVVNVFLENIPIVHPSIDLFCFCLIDRWIDFFFLSLVKISLINISLN